MALPTRDDGYVVQPADWNAHVSAINENTADVSDHEGRLQSLEATNPNATRPYAHVYDSNGGTNIPSGSNQTAVNFDTTVVDERPGTINSSGYTPSVPGWYKCIGQVQFSSSSSSNNTFRVATFNKNGEDIPGSTYSSKKHNQTGYVWTTVQAFATVSCNGSSDVIGLYADHDDGSDVSIGPGSFMMIEWVAPL